MAANGTSNGTGTAQLVGVVTAVNPKGFKLEGRDDWLNFSKFAADLVPPSRGQAVTVTLDGLGFVRAIAPAAAAPDAQQQASAGRETLIIRQTCIKASAEFCASRPDLKSADLLALAERMEAWITRGAGEAS